jgi:7-cyano-7-deazaguanine synthase in queuosine biosynthesis
MELINIDGVNIPFDKNWKKIAVSLSGGSDSALLTHILCELIVENNSNAELHIISHTRMWKTRPWQSQDSLRIFNILSNKFSNITFVRHTGFVAPDLEWGTKGPYMYDEYGKWVSGDNIQIRAFAEYTCYHNNIDVYFNAVTCNPRTDDFSGLHTRDIEPTEENKHLEFMIHMDKIISHPFRFIKKDWVVKQYRKKDLMDLFGQTRSCEGEFEGLDYRTYVPGSEVPECGECFWCKERNWAIEKSK